MVAAPPRSGPERKAHVLELLEQEQDAWIATPSGSVTGRNLAETGQVRIALGGTRDVVLVEGAVRTYPGGEVPDAYGDAFAGKLVWDPRKDTGSAGVYAYFVVTPVRVQSWREENELKGRTLMREGAWLH